MNKLFNFAKVLGAITIIIWAITVSVTGSGLY